MNGKQSVSVVRPVFRPPAGPIGDILFSTVAGGPSHVHSPQVVRRPDSIGKVSISNSLLDPNIELPTISVCDVDAVLGNIQSASPTSCSIRSSLHTGCVSQTNLKRTASNSAIYQSLGFMSHGMDAVAPSRSKEHFRSSRDISFTRELLSHGNDSARPNILKKISPCTDSTNVRFTRKTVSCESADLQHEVVCDTGNHANQRPPRLTQSIPTVTGPDPETQTVELNQSASIAAMKQKRDGIRNLTAVRIRPMIPGRPIETQRIAVGHIGLAVQTHKEASSTTSPSTCLEHRFSGSSKESKKGPYLHLAPRSRVSGTTNLPTNFPESSNRSVSEETTDSIKPTYKTKTADLVRSSARSSDERFKFVCPHPRCGCRFQAEPTLLRHLSKYHGDPVDAVRKSRPHRCDCLRRPASEERRTPALDEGCIRKANSNQHLQEMTPADCLPQTPSYALDTLHQERERETLLSTTVGSYGDGAQSDVRSCVQTPSPNSLATGSALHHLAALGSRRRLPLSSVPSISSPSGSCCAHEDVSRPVHLKAAAYLPQSLPGANRQIRQSRLRSVSGSYNVTLLDEPPVHTGSTDARCNPRSGAETTCVLRRIRTMDSEGSADSNRRRTLSSGSDPLISPGPLPSMAAPGTGIDASQSACPTCGCGPVRSEQKRREWMSGVHALTYSKTDSISCPIDGCATTCLGRAELSAHLTNVHFPEVQNQLFRLIFACPVKDCHTVCADEQNFQTHFSQHLYGDLRGLFPSVPNGLPLRNEGTDWSSGHAASCGPEAVKASDTFHLSPVRQNHTEIDSTAHFEPKRVDVSLANPEDVFPVTYDQGASSECVRSVPRQRSPQLSIATPESHLSVLPTASSLSTDPSLSACQVDMPNSDVFFELPATDMLPSPQQSRSGTDKRSDLTAESSAPPISADSNAVDLTDHRSLISALDLIPDDILMELLNEDRSGFWTDNFSGNFAMHSAPHSWDSPDWGRSDSGFPCSENDAVAENNIGYSSELEPVPSNIDHSEHTGFSSPANQIDLAYSQPDLFNSQGFSPSHNQSSSWVPSPVVQHTWSLAVANERSSDSLLGVSDFECPRHVLSDLTAALILPEVERKLRASASTKHWTSVVTAPGRSPLSDCSFGSEVLLTDEQVGRPAWIPGKRRRNASDFSPNALPDDPKVPSSHTKCLCPSSNVPKPREFEVYRDSSNMVFNNTQPFSEPAAFEQNDSLATRSLSSKHKLPEQTRTPYNNGPTDTTSNPVPISFRCRNYSESNPNNANCPHSSPKHPSLVPKKRRSNTLKAQHVSSSIAYYNPERDCSPPVLYSKTLLPRPHSMFYCSLVDPTHMPP